MAHLKSFVAVTTTELIGRLLAMGIDPVVKDSSVVNPLVGLIVTVIGILLIARDITDIYRAGIVGIAAATAFLFQFMPVLWVVLIWAALAVIAAIIESFVDHLVQLVRKLS